MTETVQSSTPPGDEADEYRRLEREWQNTVGKDLLDIPWQQPGAKHVFERQFQRIAECLDLESPGTILEIGCGKGHLLEWLQKSAARHGPRLVGIDVSEAIAGAAERGLLGFRADGEFLPLANESVRTIVYDGALHHLIDYEAGLRDAYRTLAPGGSFVLFEPVSSPFSRLVHRVVDPIVFKKVVYESPIDQHYKDHFEEDRVLATLKELDMGLSFKRTDFLAYPLTGCYAASAFGRSPRLMRFLLGVEGVVEKVPPLRWLAEVVSWRFLIIATKK
ncbi:MAG: methyltransferase domain-containing protein [Candidatus Binatia bacterium]|nr:methyltransferase domain-containing protein [Candidatus Binatia bacterium]